jgi:hypothetical protein
VYLVQQLRNHLLNRVDDLVSILFYMCAADSLKLDIFSVLANKSTCFVEKAGAAGMGALING